MAETAREEILKRVRAAVGSGLGEGWEGIERQYQRSSEMDREGLVHLLEDRLRDYDAGVYRCGRGEVNERIAEILASRGKRRMAIAKGFPGDWLPLDGEFVEDAAGGYAALDGCDGVLTTATLAIAETGTIVLQDAPGQGRRALTLVPDYHLCVVEAVSVVQTVPEAFAKLQASAGKATTFFSGPSATADIEMTRIKGVHGPRFVDVVLVMD
jgi:L-lactate dehydrogenase complex protein LldG